MDKVLKFIGYVLSVVAISFITLMIVVGVFPESELIAIATWGCVTFNVIFYFIKRWKRTRTAITIKYDRTSKYDDYDDDNEFEYSYEPKNEFKPWHEQDLLWEGNRKLFITYKDREGEITERNIEMRGIWPNQAGEICVRAKCHLRDDWRTFKGDNMLSITTARKKEFDSFSDYMSQELGI